MRFLLDESAEFRIAVFLKELEHDVTAISHDHPNALSDTQVLGIASSEQRILITNDRDFGELVFRQGLPHAGIIYFRLPLTSTAEAKISWLQRLLRDYMDQLGQFIVVTQRGVRVRRTLQR